MTHDDKLRQTIAERLTVARSASGLSQGQVAKLLGVHRPAVSQMESGQRKVSAEELSRLADLYRVDMNWLVGKDQTAGGDEIELAARELGKLKKEDLDRVVSVLSIIQKQRDKK